MPLDLTQITPQIERLTGKLTGEEYGRRIELAQSLVQTIDPQALRTRLKLRSERNERIPWLAGRPTGGLDAATPAPPPPGDFVVAAADGSNIAPDRHSPARFYVINTGRVALGYGCEPLAEMETRAALFYADEDLYLYAEQEGTEQTLPIEGTLLGAKMAVEELRALLETALAHRQSPVVALSDGTLILWTIQGLPKAARENLVGAYRQILAQFRDAGIPVASYLSKPNTQDVVNALRSFVCEGNPIHCAYCDCAPQNRLQSLDLMHVRDHQAYGFLQEGERTDVFESSSQILTEYGEHSIQFFYLNVGGEIARVEAPQWVMRDPALLDLVHAVVVDQCRRSATYPPYPPILQEAHEQAVIPTADRRVIEQMVEEALQQQGVSYIRGAKDRSKRLRAI